jgi:hypothetical protein
VPRKLPSTDEKVLHRIRIACDDLLEAVQFVEAAIDREAEGVDRRTDVLHRALVCAALIHYARAVGPNEKPNPKKRPQGAAAHRVDTTYLKAVIGTEERWKLHRQVLRLRNTIVAHAESKYFPMKMVKAQWPADPKLLAVDWGFQSFRPLPDLNLQHLRDNAREIRNYYWWQAYVLGERVRPGKRLRPPKQH